MSLSCGTGEGKSLLCFKSIYDKYSRKLELLGYDLAPKTGGYSQEGFGFFFLASLLCFSFLLTEITRVLAFKILPLQKEKITLSPGEQKVFLKETVLLMEEFEFFLKNKS